MIDANPMIKICGLTCPDLAYETARAGATHIGIMLHQPSKRFVDLATAKSIVNATRRGGAIPVAVCVDQSATEINHLCKTLTLDVVQLHGTKARQALQNLDPYIQRIYVIHIDESGNALSDNNQAMQYLNQDRDLILFDGVKGGSGQTIITEQLDALAAPFNYILAGGLNHQNIRHISPNCHPCGVDVSTGVENQQGLKDVSHIKHFITTAKEVINHG